MGRYYRFWSLTHDDHRDDELHIWYTHDDESEVMDHIEERARDTAQRNGVRIGVFTSTGRQVYVTPQMPNTPWRRWHLNFVFRAFVRPTPTEIYTIEQFVDDRLERLAQGYIGNRGMPPFDPPTRDTVE